MSSIWDYANPQLRDLAVYEPGKPIEETARELGARTVVAIPMAVELPPEPGAPTEPLPTGLHLVAAPAGAVNTTAQAAAARVSWWLSRITVPSPAPRE